VSQSHSPIRFPLFHYIPSRIFLRKTRRECLFHPFNRSRFEHHFWVCHLQSPFFDSSFLFSFFLFQNMKLKLWSTSVSQPFMLFWFTQHNFTIRFNNMRMKWDYCSSHVASSKRKLLRQIWNHYCMSRNVGILNVSLIDPSIDPSFYFTLTRFSLECDRKRTKCSEPCFWFPCWFIRS